MRANAPRCLTKGLSTSDLSSADRWWQGLPPGDRRALRCNLVRTPTGVVARFVEAGEPDDGDGSVDFYEYLVNHEVLLGDGRTFHICSAHAEARALLARGRVPSGFRCPRGDAACPMRALLDLAGGREVRLALADRTGPTADGAHG